MQIDSLKFLNAVVGFCVNDPRWPHPLHDADYHAYFVEKEISVRIGSGTKYVVADVILSSETDNHAVCVELKSATISPTQRDRYLAILPEDLFDQGLVAPRCSRSTLSHDILYMTDSQNKRALGSKLKGCAVAMVVGDEQHFRLAQGSFRSQILEHTFRKGVNVTARDWPSSHIQFTSELEHRQKLLSSFLTALSGLIIFGEDFTHAALTEKSVPHWKIIGQQERRTFMNLVLQMLKTASVTELSIYLSKIDDENWRCSLGKLEVLQSIQKLSRLVREHSDRIQAGTAYKPPRPGQLGLKSFDSLL